MQCVYLCIYNTHMQSSPIRQLNVAVLLSQSKKLKHNKNHHILFLYFSAIFSHMQSLVPKALRLLVITISYQFLYLHYNIENSSILAY